MTNEQALFLYKFSLVLNIFTFVANVLMSGPAWLIVLAIVMIIWCLYWIGHFTNLTELDRERQSY